MRNFFGILFIIFLLGCSQSGSPIIPADSNADLITPPSSTVQSGGAFSLGLFEVTLDPVAKSAEIVPLRGADFTANITVFLQPPLGHAGWIEFSNFDISDFPTEGIIRLDIAVTHPFAGSMDLRGFDTHGVFMSDADFLPGFPAGGIVPRQDGSDAIILNADGYTRWNNALEFTAENIFGYFAGNFGIPGFTPSATVNGYKYHCTGIEEEEDIFDYFSDPDNLNRRGSFTPGDVSKRRYEILFPNPQGSLLFQYNVLTCWDAPSTSTNPQIEDYPLTANSMEAFLLDIDTSGSTVYYVNETSYGGSIHIDLTVYDWQAMDSVGGGINVDDSVAGIYIDSFTDTFLGTPIDLKPSATVLPDGTVSSTYSIDIADVTPTKAGDEWIVIAVESADPTSYDQGFPVPVAMDPLAAYLVASVNVVGHTYNAVPDISDIEGDEFPNIAENYTAIASDPESDPIHYQWSLVDDGLPPVWENIGSDTDVINIDWPTYDPGGYDLHCRVNDDYHSWDQASSAVLDITYGASSDPVGDLDLSTGRTAPDVLDPVTEVIISWDDAPNEAEYAIYADLDPWNGLTDNLELVGTAVQDSTSWSHDASSLIPLSGNISYAYIVRTRAVAGNENTESADSEVAFIELENFENGSADGGGIWTHVTQMGDDLLYEGNTNPINGSMALEEIAPFKIGEAVPADNIWLVVVSPELPDIDDVDTANFEFNHHSSGIAGSYCTRNVGTLSAMPVPNPSGHTLYDFDSLWYDGYAFVYNYRTDNNGWAHGWSYVWGEDFPPNFTDNIEWFITYAGVLHAFSGYSFMDTWMGGTGYPDGRRYVALGVSLGWLSYDVTTYRVDDIAVIID